MNSSQYFDFLKPFEAALARGEKRMQKIVKINGRQAKAVATQRGLHHKRNVSWQMVAALTHAMDRGTFYFNPEMKFAPNKSGKLVLVDGQHRLIAHFEHELTQGKEIIKPYIINMDRTPAENVYAELDRIQRSRSDADAGNALGYGEMFDVPLAKKVVSAAGAGLHLLYDRPSQVIQSLDNTEVKIPFPPEDRRRYIEERMEAFRAVDTLIPDLPWFYRVWLQERPAAPQGSVYCCRDAARGT